MKIIFKNKILMGIILFGIVLLFKFSTLNLPYTDDELSYVTPTAKWIQEHNFNPFAGIIGVGHPPLFYEILAMTWSIFGDHLWITHSVVLIFSSLAIYFTYLFGADLYGEIAGIIAALLLFFSPMFFAHSGIATLDMPLTAIAIMTIYFLRKNNIFGYLITGICLVFIKETGVIFISSILAYVIYKNIYKTKRELFIQILLLSIPLLAYLVWAIVHKSVVGWFFYPLNVGLFSNAISNFMMRPVKVIYQFFLCDYRWVLTLFIICALFFRKNILKKESTLLLFIISFCLAFFIIYSSLPRHFLLIYPFFFIISGAAIDSLLAKRKKVLGLFIILLVVLFISEWRGKTGQHEWSGPTNMEYVDHIMVNKLAVNYIENNYPLAIVIGEFLGGSRMFREPYLGYVKRPLKTIDLKNHKGNFEGDKFYIVYYSPDVFNRKISKKIILDLDLKMIRKFEINGKFVELYGREKT